MRLEEALVGVAALAVLLAGIVARPGLPAGPDPAGNTPVATLPVAVERAAPTAVRLAIPALDLDRPLVPLTRQRSGELAVPASFDDVGVWRGGPTDAPVVLAGHVDSRSGPAVFAGLRRLVPGDEVRVGTATGGTTRFVVERVERYRKAEFPTFEVFGGDPETLRLITCGGRFDRATGSYEDNVVVYARPVVAS